MDILQALYDSEINFAIFTFWDAGFDAKIGDAMNGFCWEEGGFTTLQQTIDALAAAACVHYPDSAFAKSRNAPVEA